MYYLLPGDFFFTFLSMELLCSSSQNGYLILLAAFFANTATR